MEKLPCALGEKDPSPSAAFAQALGLFETLERMGVISARLAHSAGIGTAEIVISAINEAAGHEVFRVLWICEKDPGKLEFLKSTFGRCVPSIYGDVSEVASGASVLWTCQTQSMVPFGSHRSCVECCQAED